MHKSLEAILASLVFGGAGATAACSTTIVDSGPAGSDGSATDTFEAGCGNTTSSTTTSSSTFESSYTSSTSFTCSSTAGCACCGTPLVMEFFPQQVELVADDRHEFSLFRGESVATDWPTAATPWLILDRNGDGAIGDGGELFGSATVLRNGALARNGFEALAELDADGDGWITPSDLGFARLALWRDRDGDRKSTPDELQPAAEVILAIELAYTDQPRCDARGNCERERAVFYYRGDDGSVRSGQVVDVHLARQR